MKVGVTGAAGFIGGHVVDQLVERGHTVVAFDQRGRAVPGAETMLGDCRDDVAVTELAAHVDGIIHLASVLGTQETISNPRPAVMTNVIAGMNAMEAAAQYGLPIVNICTGNFWMRNSYAASKRCVETLAEMYRDDRGLAVNQVRVVNAYGSRQSVAKPYGSAKVRKIVPSFACRALAGDPIEVYGSGDQVSDCVHVTDVARVLVKALERAADGHVFDAVVEVGPTEHLTVLQVAKAVQHIAYSHTGRMAPIVHLPMRPGEEPGARVVADTSTLALVDEDPADFVTLADGLRDVVAWFAANEGVTWSRP